MEFDFSGYATRADVKCSDGRTIKPNAFKSDDGKQVPLCWQHGHSDVNNVLGHAVLENRPDGVYTYCKFNETANGQNAKALVLHKDVTSLSIYANNLVERGKDVVHGVIREVSLVLAGANSGALIDNVIMAHDGFEETLDDEAVIFSGEEIDVLEHADPEDDEVSFEEAEDDDDVEHFGVKGMKWGVRKDDSSGGSRRASRKAAALKANEERKELNKPGSMRVALSRTMNNLKNGDPKDLVKLVIAQNDPRNVVSAWKAGKASKEEIKALKSEFSFKDRHLREMQGGKAQEYQNRVNAIVTKNLNATLGKESGNSSLKYATYNGMPFTYIETKPKVEHADDDSDIPEGAIIMPFTYDEQGFIDGFMDSAIDELERAMAAEHADTDTEARTYADIYEDMTDEEKGLVQYILSQFPDDDSSDDEDDSAEHGNTDGEVLGTSDSTITTNDANQAEEGNNMKHNIFEAAETTGPQISLSHSDIKGIVEDARKIGSLKDAVEKYALQHGIENIDLLFPDAKAITNTPDFVKRQTEWVNDVMSGTRHTPFSRIKSMTADLTVEEARAKGYVKGNMKREEFFALAKRTTTPQTVYKKQKLDRDDIIDITDFDVVTWLKAEMRLMLNEEIARAILIGDGRSNADDDKIKEENIRPIATDAELYVTTVYAKVTDNDATDIVDSLVRYRRHYKGSGNPTFFTSEDVLASLLLSKDTIGRRLYSSVTDLAAALRVSKIVAVEVFDVETDLLGIMVNLNDYVVGSDKGGAISLFDDFDIDYNQYKYLIETRLSGALVRPKSAVVVRKAAAADTLTVPAEPSFDATTGVVTIPTTTGVVYESPLGTAVTGTITVASGESVTVFAVPATGHYFPTNADDEWTFTRKA